MTKNYFKRADGITEIFPTYPENCSHSPKSISQAKTYVPFSEKKRIIEQQQGFCFRSFIAHSDDLSDIIEEYEKNEEVAHGMLLVEITPFNSGLVYIPYNGESLQTIDDYIFTIFNDTSLWLPLLNKALDKYLNTRSDLLSGQKNKIRSFVQSRTNKDFSLDILLLPAAYPEYDLETEIYRPANRIIEGTSTSNFNNFAQCPSKPSRRLLDYLIHATIEYLKEDSGVRSAISAIYDRDIQTTHQDIAIRMKKTSFSNPDQYLVSQINKIKKTI